MIMQTKPMFGVNKFHQGIKLIFVMAMIVIFATQLHQHLPEWIASIRALGHYAVLGFFILYCLAILFFLPVAPIILAGGAIFGFYYGFLINLFCAVISAFFSFLISRYVGLTWLSPRKQAELSRWFSRFQSLGWRSLATARVTPFLPCSIINYAFGLTRIKISTYNLTNLIFFIPYKLIATYIGAHL